MINVTCVSKDNKIYIDKDVYDRDVMVVNGRLQKAKNNLSEDISTIKTLNLSKYEIIQRLEETLKILKGK